VVFTGISVLVGVAALCLLYTQTRATKIAADAAKKSAEVAELALRLAERADIALDSCAIVGEVLNGADTRVVLQFKNFGRTRAKDVRLYLNVVIEDCPPTDYSKIPPITMGAGETKDISSEQFADFLTAETARRIFSRQTPLKFEGGVSYKDVFDAPHASHYTGTYDWDTRLFHIDNQESD